MRRAFKWPMTAAWFAMGVLVTLGFYQVRVDAQSRCEAGNDFRRASLPAAFELHDRKLGEVLGATDQQYREFEADFQADLDALFPQRDCPLLW